MRTNLLLAALVVGLSLMAGCDTSPRSDVDQLRADIADDLVTYGQTQGQVDNQITRTSYHNMRGINDDLMRILLLDRPSRSSYYPVE